MSTFRKITSQEILVRLVSLLVIMLLSLSQPGGIANAQNTTDLALTKQAVSAVRVGQNVVYTITLTNLGPTAATDVQFGDSLPDQLNLVSFRCLRGAPTGGSFCLVNRLEPGQTAVALIVATPIANIAWEERRVSNTAFIASSTSVDPNDSNNTDSVIIIAVQ
jgi:uncharacterized repeat protein (TIGR01451 family)